MDLLLGDTLDPVASHDIVIEKGELLLVTGADAVIQRISNRCNIFFGEWFVDVREGVPYFSDLFLQGIDPEYVAQVFRRIIQDVEGVLEVIDVVPTLDKRAAQLNITFTARIEGDQLLTDRSFIVRL